MKFYYLHILLLCLCFSEVFSQSENVGINTNGAAPHNSAILEVKSSDKGVLIPRLNDVSVIASPAVGLLVYNTSKNCFSYYIGSGQWLDFPGPRIKTLQDRDNDTKIYADKTSADDDTLRFTSGLKMNVETEIATVNAGGINLSRADAAYKVDSRAVVAVAFPDTSMFVGIGAGGSIVSGSNNLFFGYNAGANVISSNHNTFFGFGAGANSLGSYNTFVGANSGSTQILGNKNLALGYNAMLNAGSASDNVSIGAESGKNIGADSNIFIGSRAGAAVVNGTGSIVIGNGIELSADARDTLVLGNKNGSKITANLSSRRVWFNGYSFPGEAGEAGEILKLDASNNLNWAGRVPREVAGALADMQPFNKILSSSKTSLGDSIFYMKIISYASARVDSIKTYVYNPAGASNLFMGLYDENMAILGQGSVSLTAEGYYSVAINGNDGVNAISSKIYYLGIYTNDPSAEFMMMEDKFNKPIVEETGAIIQLPNNISGGVGLNSMNIWLHAF